MNPQENDVLHPEFLRRMQAMLSPNDYAAYLCALSEPPRRLARKNPLKSVPDALLAAELGGYPFLPPEAKPGRGALHAAGIQKGTAAVSGGKPAYDAGDRVRHVKYGEGTVTDLEPGPRDYRVTVDFDGAGQKIMYAAFAKLEKV